MIGLDLLSTGIPAGSRIDTNGDGTNENNSVYSRFSFNVSDPNAIDALSLDMRYDDGFVAYLNDQEVARANAPASPQWNSTATADRGDTGEVMITHEGEEGGVVLAGQVEITVGDQVRVLGPGEAYYFECRIPHRFRNVGDTDVMIVSASTPPTF